MKSLCTCMVSLLPILLQMLLLSMQTMVQVMSPCFAPITVHADVRVGVLQPVVDCAQVQKSVSKQSRPKQAVKDTIDQMTTLNRPGPKCQGQSGCTPVAV